MNNTHCLEVISTFKNWNSIYKLVHLNVVMTSKNNVNIWTLIWKLSIPRFSHMSHSNDEVTFLFVSQELTHFSGVLANFFIDKIISVFVGEHGNPIIPSNTINSNFKSKTFKNLIRNSISKRNLGISHCDIA